VYVLASGKDVNAHLSISLVDLVAGMTKGSRGVESFSLMWMDHVF
jgi:hypothetical protein